MVPHHLCLGGLQRCWAFYLTLSVAMFAGHQNLPGEILPLEAGSMTVVCTNILQVRQLAIEHTNASCSVDIEGIVLETSPQRDQFILQDDVGGMVVKMDVSKQPSVQPGEKILLQGECLASGDGISAGAFIDNDGGHASLEKSDSLFLSAGLHPITVEWFNGPGNFDLALDYTGPELPRRRIPDSALYRSSEGAGNQLTHGLNFIDYEGEWDRLPVFSQLPVLKSGIVVNFNLEPRSRDTNVGLVFKGYVEAPRSGDYTFWLRSDDGSKLYLNDSLHLTPLGHQGLPLAHQISPTQLASLAWQWGQVEGAIVRVRESYQGVSIELNSGGESIYLNVMGGNYNFLKQLLHCRIKASGIYQNACNIDGQTVAFLLVPASNNIAITEVDSSCWSDIPLTSISGLVKTNFSLKNETVVHTSGIISSNVTGNYQLMLDKSDHVLIKSDQRFVPGEQVELLGWWSHTGAETILSGCIGKMLSRNNGYVPAGLPQLEKAIQVKSLSRAEAQRGYPVEIRGVITARIAGGFVIQDSTWSVFCYWDGVGSEDYPKIGEYWEIKGNSDVHFAPDILVHRVKYLRPCILPEPIQPTRDELVNGSLDTQTIELQGIATAVETNNITLLTREGKITFYGPELNQPDEIKGSLVRIRGVFMVERDTNQMILPTLSLFQLLNASVSVDEAVPAHPFEMPLKHASDLLLFDARADALRRVKVAGLVLYGRQGEYFLMDDGYGLRFEPDDKVTLQPGDLVEVVGFPDVSKPSPILREALVRITGKTGLPKARHLTEETAVEGKLDATLVSLESRLVSLRSEHSEHVLEMQAGTRSYLARLPEAAGVFPDILPGSQLELTGVYAAQGGGLASGRDIDTFELLLRMPSDIRVLARPSWWTFRHTVTVFGGMAFVILAGVIWITLLRRQVEERSRQLAKEIRGREQAEYHRALEGERTRIAQDLHDELGATLTEIRFIGAIKYEDSLVPEATRFELKEVSEKADQMVSSLDEIVWAVNPANDSLPNLANYLCHLAVEFFRTAEMRCRLDVDQTFPPVALTSEVRHNLYLAVREALNNIRKHSHATEAWLRIHCAEQVIHIVIEDNGRGFAVAGAGLRGNGLANMQSRLKNIGGCFEYDTRPGFGTVCRIKLNLPQIRS